jgi:predicted Fe-Mo cluster-binding NifX family protein
MRHDVRIEERDPIDKAKRIIALGAEVLICGAISWPLELMLESAGVMVMSNLCGMVDDVISAFIAGRLPDQAFLMPGCTGHGRRHRHRACRRFVDTSTEKKTHPQQGRREGPCKTLGPPRHRQRSTK